MDLLQNRALGVVVEVPYVISVYILLSSMNIVALDDLHGEFSMDLLKHHSAFKVGGAHRITTSPHLLASSCHIRQTMASGKPYVFRPLHPDFLFVTNLYRQSVHKVRETL